MADNLDAKAVIQVVVEGLDKAVGQFEQLYNSTGSKQYDQFGRSIARVSGQIKGAGTAATGAANSIKQIKPSLSGIDDGNLPRLRYALYDVASTANIAAAAITATGVAALAASASYESAFTSVERTSRVTGESAGNLKDQLLALTTQIPSSFGDIAGIATLGAQLNIATGDLQEFAKIVAQSSATMGTTTEATASGFGRIGQLLKVPVSEYENLASAILYTGNTSIATESDVLNYTQRLAVAGQEAGFTAQQVVALGSTLASLGIGLEAAQGATQRIFQQITRDVSAGGKALESYAQISGESATKFAEQWKKAPQEAFSALAEGLSKQGDLTKALDSIGIVETREVRVMQALANNTDLYNEQLANSAQAYKDGTYLASSYGKVVDDLASRFQVFLNSLATFGASVGDALAPAAKVVLDIVSQVLQGLTVVANNPLGKWAIGIAGVLGAVSAAMLGLVGVIALAVASFAALRTAATALGLQNATTGLAGFAGGLFGVSTAAGGASVALNVFKVALASTGIGLAVLALGALSTAFADAGFKAQKAFDTYVGSTGGLSDAVAADTKAYQDALAAGNTSLADSFAVLTPKTLDNLAANDDNARAIANVNEILGVTGGQIDSVTGAIQNSTAALGANTTEWLKNQFRQSDAFREFAGNDEMVSAWNSIGANFDDAVAAQLANGKQGLYDYFRGLSEQALASGSTTIDQISQISGGIALALSGGEGKFGKFTSEVGTGFGGVLTNTLQGLFNQVTLLPPSMSAAANATGGLGDAAQTTAPKLDKVGKSAGGATKQVRTLVDYANDLSSVWTRAFDIRFSSQTGLDAITTGWNEVRDASEDAAKAMRDANATLSSLAADRNVLKYQLSIANLYKDEKRAAQIRADLAENSNKTTDAQKDLTDAQQKNNKTLVGNSKAAIANRATVTGMVTDYQSYIQSLAASGASQKELDAAVKQSKQAFIDQATALGFSKAEIQKYAKSFDDMSVAINRVPRNITVTANVNPALQALNELEAKARKVGNTMGGIGGSTGKDVDTLIKKRARALALMAQIGVLAIQSATAKNPVAALGYKAGIAALELSIKNLGAFRSGGYTGNFGVNDVAGVVHGREYVMSAPAVRNAGGPNAMNYMHNLLKSGRGLPVSGGGSGGFTTLDAASIDAIGRSVARYAQSLSIAPGAVQARRDRRKYQRQRAGEDVMAKVMWFGPRGYETWVRMPRIDMDSLHMHVGTRADQIRGGVSVRESRAGHQEYGMSWNAATRDEMGLIQDVADGIYSSGANENLIHFIDPAAADKNLLPKLWASPALCAYGAPSLTKGVKPTVAATATNSTRLPAETATFTVGASDLLELYVPIPPGYTLYYGFYGPTAQAGKIQRRPVNKTTVGTAVTSNVIVNSSYGTGMTSLASSATVTGAILRLTPSGGSVAITAGLMILRKTSEGAPATPSAFISGRGNSGCVIEPGSLQSVVNNVYWDRASMLLRLIERGSWQ